VRAEVGEAVDHHLHGVALDQRGERVVGITGLDGLVQLDEVKVLVLQSMRGLVYAQAKAAVVARNFRNQVECLGVRTIKAHHVLGHISVAPVLHFLGEILGRIDIHGNRRLELQARDALDDVQRALLFGFGGVFKLAALDGGRLRFRLGLFLRRRLLLRLGLFFLIRGCRLRAALHVRHGRAFGA